VPFRPENRKQAQIRQGFFRFSVSRATRGRRLSKPHSVKAVEASKRHEFTKDRDSRIPASAAELIRGRRKDGNPLEAFCEATTFSPW